MRSSPAVFVASIAALETSRSLCRVALQTSYHQMQVTTRIARNCNCDPICQAHDVDIEDYAKVETLCGAVIEARTPARYLLPENIIRNQSLTERSTLSRILQQYPSYRSRMFCSNILATGLECCSYSFCVSIDLNKADITCNTELLLLLPLHNTTRKSHAR